MSAVRAFKTDSTPASAFRIIAGKSTTQRAVARVVVLGTIGVVLVGLLLNIMIAQSAYEMANLKSRTKELNMTSQVLQQQVSSLASNQNLEQAAHDMGMVANATPVFLSVQDQKVFGRPLRASYSNSLSRNLVANSALTSVTNVKSLENATAKAAAIAAASLAASVKTLSGNALNVAAPKIAVKKVSLPSGGIPGSPTH